MNKFKKNIFVKEKLIVLNTPDYYLLNRIPLLCSIFSTFFIISLRLDSTLRIII